MERDVGLTVTRSPAPPYQRHQGQYSPDFNEVPRSEGGYSYDGHRLSDKIHRPRSPRAESPIPIWEDEGAKEVVDHPSEHPYRYPQPDQKEKPVGLGVYEYEDERRPSSREYCGLSKKWFFILMAGIILIICGIALGAGLGVGLGQDKESYAFALEALASTTDESQAGGERYT